ncbi:MAG: glycoside hydrolase family 9 protein [Bacteroidales bacterium]|nr:glycoside hydrolase family 9 protein [Bacteroidales bacterium]
MNESPSDGAYSRWLAKPVTDSRRIPLTTDGSSASVSVIGPATISIDKALTYTGDGSVRLDCAASTARKKDTNRNYGTPEIFCPLGGEDISEWNRISCQVYVDAPGYYTSFLGFKVYNEGEHIEPVPGRFEGEHCFTVIPGRWTRIVWEIPDIYRDNVKGISVNIMMMGETSGSDSRMSLYLDDLRLDKVDADPTRGFQIRPGAIAYSHSGYKSGLRKQAVFCSHSPEPVRFRIIDKQTRRRAFAAESIVTPAGNSLYYHTLDFTDLQKEGLYYIKTPDITSDVFPIGDKAYSQTAWRGINYFFSERCGFDLPHVHEKCHTDVSVHHPDGRSINWAGGWHDAADVSQGAGNNNEAVIALLELAASTSDPALKKRALQEARWGLDWLLHTRFGDGYRANFLIMGIWSDNIIGTKDDMSAEASRDAINNFRCAEAFAFAAPFYANEDPVFARWLTNAAVQDFRFATEDFIGQSTQDFAFASVSAARLYNLTNESAYLDYAASYADGFLAALQKEPKSEWALPLRGFFYEDATCSRILAYYHQSQEHKPAQALSLLLKAAPTHPSATRWKAACEMMATYYIMTSDAMEPFGLSPAAIYEVGNTDYSTLYHEGEKIGLPSMEEYNAQVREGIFLADSTYLRRFPVAYQFRGFNGVTLAKAKAMFILADATRRQDLADIAARQVEWVVGFNPFAASTVYGDGYDYPPLYGAYAGDVVGAVPVGIETFENEDKPYWPTQVNATYKEIWTHSTARLLSVIAELNVYMMNF